VILIKLLNKANYLLGKSVPFSTIFPSSRSLYLLKKGLESPGKVLEFHLHLQGGHPEQSNDTNVMLPLVLCKPIHGMQKEMSKIGL
jgi:hypothetical protein